MALIFDPRRVNRQPHPKKKFSIKYFWFFLKTKSENLWPFTVRFVLYTVYTHIDQHSKLLSNQVKPQLAVWGARSADEKMMMILEKTWSIAWNSKLLPQLTFRAARWEDDDDCKNRHFSSHCAGPNRVCPGENVIHFTALVVVKVFFNWVKIIYN